MKHVFILNPAAGKHQGALQVQPQAEAFFEAHPMEHAFFVTSHPGEATEIAKRECAEGHVRVYACGGDGTVLEVLNGLKDAPHTELASVPCGSGNDFLRIMPQAPLFHDIASLICGRARPVDVIRCDDRLSLNMCSMGMDATVADRMGRYKHWPLVSGSMAYNLAVARTFFGKLGQKLRIIMETDQGTVEREGDYLFALAANGQYYGGGYKGSPLSQPDDGVLDFVLIKTVSHFGVLRLLDKYKKGLHLDLPCCEMFRGTSMRVLAETPAVVTADGECFSTTDVSFSILPGAVSFVFPAETQEEMLNFCEKSDFSQIKA